MAQYYVALEMTDWSDGSDIGYGVGIGPYRSYEVAKKVAKGIQKRIDRSPANPDRHHHFEARVQVAALRTPAEARIELKDWIDNMLGNDEDGDE